MKAASRASPQPILWGPRWKTSPGWVTVWPSAGTTSSTVSSSTTLATGASIARAMSILTGPTEWSDWNVSSAIAF